MPVDPPVPTLLVTRDEAARLLACCPRTVDSLLKTGAIPAVRLGRAVRVRRADLEAFAAKLAESQSAEVNRA